MREDPTIGEIATKYGVTPTQIILAWHTERGVVAVPAARNPEHQKENLNVRLTLKDPLSQPNSCFSDPVAPETGS